MIASWVQVAEELLGTGSPRFCFGKGTAGSRCDLQGVEGCLVQVFTEETDSPFTSKSANNVFGAGYRVGRYW